MCCYFGEGQWAAAQRNVHLLTNQNASYYRLVMCQNDPLDISSWATGLPLKRNTGVTQDCSVLSCDHDWADTKLQASGYFSIWNCKTNSLAATCCSTVLHKNSNVDPFVIMSYQSKETPKNNPCQKPWDIAQLHFLNEAYSLLHYLITPTGDLCREIKTGCHRRHLLLLEGIVVVKFCSDVRLLQEKGWNANKSRLPKSCLENC